MAFTEATSVATAPFDNTTASYDPPPQARKDILNALHAVSLALSLYLFVALLVHEWSKRSSTSSRYPGSIGGTLVGGGKSMSRRLGKWLRVLCIVSAMLCCSVCISDLVYYNTDMDSGWRCTFSRNIEVVILTMLDVTIYLFLWLRQYLVYESLPFDNRFAKNIINVLKWTTLGLILGTFVVTNSLIACCRRYVYDFDNDKCRGTTSVAIYSALGYIWSVGSLVLHCTLVLMFIFPLIRLWQKRQKKALACAAAVPQRRVKVLVRRCLAVSVGCVVTDVAVMMLGNYALRGSYNSQLRHLLYNLNVLLNSTLIVVSFREWRQMLLPWVRTSRAAATESSHQDTGVETQQTAYGWMKT